MKITKLCVATELPTGKQFRISIYTDVYSKSLQYINILVKIAKRDFPFLNNENIDVIIYGGRYIKHIMGIEFTVSAEVMKPEYNYQEVSSLEPTL